MRPSGPRTWTPDHPRSRGVYSRMPPQWRRRSGSSPLARGLPSTAGAEDCAWGIIPARAGFTARPWPPRPRPRDHPRSRGVYVRPPSARSPPPGSSPHARGLPAGRSPPGSPAGIIPARAGFTAGMTTPASAARDHPRSRGVYATLCLRFPIHSGSSPLARGLLAGIQILLGDRGIIPARAGFTGRAP